MDRQIVCLAIPSLEIALTRLHDPLLRTRPLAVAPRRPSEGAPLRMSSHRIRLASTMRMVTPLRGLGNPPILPSRTVCESLQDHGTDPALSKRKNGVNIRLVSVLN